MRTTIRIDDGLYRQAKATAAKTGRSVSELIEDAVRSSLQARPEPLGEIADLPVFGGSGTMPGVDLSDGPALRDVMDEDDPLRALR